MPHRPQIAVLTPSPVLAAGVSAMLSRVCDRLVSAITCADISDVTSLTEMPEAVLLDPMSIHPREACAALERAEMSQVKLILLSVQNLPGDVVAHADAVLGIYDGDDRWEQTVRKLCLDSSQVDADNSSELTSREREVVTAIVKGLSNKEIANLMNVSTHTIMTHRRNIARKLQIHSAAGLTIYAIVKKLVSIDQIKKDL